MFDVIESPLTYEVFSLLRIQISCCLCCWRCCVDPNYFAAGSSLAPGAKGSMSGGGGGDAAGGRRRLVTTRPILKQSSKSDEKADEEPMTNFVRIDKVCLSVGHN